MPVQAQAGPRIDANGGVAALPRLTNSVVIESIIAVAIFDEKGPDIHAASPNPTAGDSSPGVAGTESPSAPGGHLGAVIRPGDIIVRDEIERRVRTLLDQLGAAIHDNSADDHPGAENGSETPARPSAGGADVMSWRHSMGMGGRPRPRAARREP